MTRDTPPAKLRRDTSLKAARAWLLTERGGKGAVCPCCDQTARIYRRPFSANMCMFAVALYRAGGTRHPVHGYSITGTRGGDESRLVHWGLITPATEPIDGKTRGYWTLTKAGTAFVRNKLAVPSYALIYNGDLVELRGPKVKISDLMPMYNPSHIRIQEGALELPLLDPTFADHA